MSDPIPDGPPPDATPATGSTGGVPTVSPGPSLCGFVLPIPRFNYGFRPPNLGQLFPFPPKLPGLPLGLKCDPDDPLGVVGKPVYGGGRVGVYPPSPDDDDGQSGAS